MSETWNQLSILAQWLTMLSYDLGLGKGRADMAACDTDQLGERLRDLIRRHAQTSVEDAAGNAQRPTRFFEVHYKQVLRQMPLSIWHELFDALRRDRLPLTQREVHDLDRLSRLWWQLESAHRRIRLDAVAPFVAALAHLLDWEIAKQEHIGNETVFWLKTPGLHARLGPIVVLIVTIVQRAPGSGEKAERWATDLLRRANALGIGATKVGINVIVGAGAELARYKRLFRDRDDLLAFDELVLREVLTADRCLAKVEAIIKSSLGLARLNPYNSEKPVEKPDMFFGREKEIRAIIDNPAKDFAIVGSRKIGKSSLLTYLREVVSHSTNRTAVFIDCAAVRSPDELAHKMAMQVNPRRAERMRMSMVGQMLHAAYSVRRRPFLLLLDEADRLIELATSSGDWTTLEVIRALANQGVCQTVMTGYKVLYEAWQARSTPLFNFVSPVYLSVLARESAIQLVAKPMKEVGVEFTDRNLIKQIVDESGCHPSFLQFFCSVLIDVLAERKTREVTAAEVDAVRARVEYREFVLKPFRAEGDFSLLERWLVLSLAGEKIFDFDGKAIMENLGSKERWLKTGDTDKALRSLELGGLIRASSESTPQEPRGLQYTWTIPAFVRVLERTTDIQKQAEELRQELVAGGGRNLKEEA